MAAPTRWLDCSKFLMPVVMLVCLGHDAATAQQEGLGLFAGRTDIGAVSREGLVRYTVRDDAYRIAASGTNMWFDSDEFTFAWKKVSGDAALAAEVRWITPGVDPHRKACLLVRQSLEPGAVYADVAIHGDGLTSLQYRDAPGGPTREIVLSTVAPPRVQLEKRGDYVFALFGTGDGKLAWAGGSVRVKLTAPFYVGLGVCAHDNEVVEEAEFARISLDENISPPAEDAEVASSLETIDVETGNRRVVYATPTHIEAPNWSRDGKYLLFNREGRIFRAPVAGGEPVALDTGSALTNNNDHGLSPDGKLLAISDQTEGPSRIHVLPADGGQPRLITPLGPSYWHGWSPDGHTLAYCAERNGEYDVYTIPVAGGEETRITSAAGLDDGPDYSPDGRFIYFNSDRTGTMQIYRMKPDGSEPTQLTHDDFHDWFAHPSPDGKWLVFVTFPPEVEGHPANQHVMLRIMPAEGGEVRVLTTLFGGQGTMNVPSWSPDSRQVAFVSYRLVSRE